MLRKAFCNLQLLHMCRSFKQITFVSYLPILSCYDSWTTFSSFITKTCITFRLLWLLELIGISLAATPLYVRVQIEHLILSRLWDGLHRKIISNRTFEWLCRIQKTILLVCRDILILCSLIFIVCTRCTHFVQRLGRIEFLREVGRRIIVRRIASNLCNMVA